MISCILISVLLGGFAFVNTSKKAVLGTSSIELWLQERSSFSIGIGWGFTALALVLSIVNYGTVSGFMFWLLAVITLLSLVVLINPLKLFNYKLMGCWMALIISFEILMSYAS